MKKPFVLIAAIVAVVVFAAIAVDDGRAQASHASHLSCGDTITADTTLDSDLVNCPNNGIVIGADNVTLDLNGHTIDGDGFIQGGHQEDTGVSIFEHDGITVKHGSIRQFGNTGLNAVGVRDIRLLGLAASQNDRFGITVSAADADLDPKLLGQSHDRRRQRWATGHTIVWTRIRRTRRSASRPGRQQLVPAQR